MKVIILCGGRGTRLHEETSIKPKPMVEIGGKPILWHIMKTYSAYGFNDFVICLGYKGYLIKEFFLNYEYLTNDFTVSLGSQKEIAIHNEHAEQGWSVTLAETGVNTLKGARIKKIENYIDTDNILITYGDGVADININALVEFHKQHGKIGTISGVRPPSRFGELEIQGKQIAKFSEKPQTSSGMINGGFMVFKRELFNYLSSDENCDFEKGPLEVLAEEGNLMVFEHSGQWECMDTVRDMDNLNKLWNENRAFWKVWD